MKNKKKVFRRFEYCECDDMARYLNAMAQEGWQFSSFITLGYAFEKDENASWKYIVEVFPNGREFDYGPSGDVKEFADYCDLTGYELVDGRGKMCVFRCKKEDEIVEIFDEKERYANVTYGMKRNSILLAIALVAVLLINSPILSLLGVGNIGTDMDMLFDRYLLILEASVGFLIVWYVLMKIWNYFHTKRNYRRAEGRAYYGKNPNGNPKKVAISHLVGVIVSTFAVCAFLYWTISNHYYFGIGIFALYLLLIFAPRMIASKFKLHGRSLLMLLMLSFVVTFAVIIGVEFTIFTNEGVIAAIGASIEQGKAPFAEEDMTLQVEDVYGESRKVVQINQYLETGSFLGSLEQYDVDYGNDKIIDYTLYQSDFDWMLDFKFREVLNQLGEGDRYLGKRHKDDVSKDWGVDHAYFSYYLIDESMKEMGENRFDEVYVVRLKKHVLVMRTYGKLTQEQIQSIKKKILANL